MKKLCALSLVMLVTLGVAAQIKLGAKAGVNFANVAQNFKSSFDESKTKLKAGFHVGVVATKELSEVLDFTTGLIYSQKGLSSDLEDGIPSGESIDGYQRLTLSYLEIPINFEYKIGAVRIIAGPYVAFGISGKNKWDYEASFGGFGGSSSRDVSGESKNIKFKNTLGESEARDGNVYYRVLDLGFNAGIGYQIKDFAISANYGFGLSNLFPDSDTSNTDFDDGDFKMSNRVISIGATYYFSK